jgi:hypothetical protein
MLHKVIFAVTCDAILECYGRFMLSKMQSQTKCEHGPNSTPDAFYMYIFLRDEKWKKGTKRLEE